MKRPTPKRLRVVVTRNIVYVSIPSGHVPILQECTSDHSARQCGRLLRSAIAREIRAAIKADRKQRKGRK